MISLDGFWIGCDSYYCMLLYYDTKIMINEES